MGGGLRFVTQHDGGGRGRRNVTSYHTSAYFWCENTVNTVATTRYMLAQTMFPLVLRKYDFSAVSKGDSPFRNWFLTRFVKFFRALAACDIAKSRAGYAHSR